jgi:hypothetical protein
MINWVGLKDRARECIRKVSVPCTVLLSRTADGLSANYHLNAKKDSVSSVFDFNSPQLEIIAKR